MLKIPGHIEEPPAVPLNSDIVKNSNVVVFDLKTTSLYSECEKVQIAATDGETHFNEYYLLGSIQSKWHLKELWKALCAWKQSSSCIVLHSF